MILFDHCLLYEGDLLDALDFCIGNYLNFNLTFVLKIVSIFMSLDIFILSIPIPFAGLSFKVL